MLTAIKNPFERLHEKLISPGASLQSVLGSWLHCFFEPAAASPRLQQDLAKRQTP
jgi:hypothetical protein